MPSKVSFECPGCLAKLSAPDKSKLGKKIKCPKCQEVFTPEVSEDDEDSFEMDDDLDEEPAEESPRRKGPVGGGKKGAGKKGGKGGSSSEGSKSPLIIGGIVGVLVLIGGGFMLLSKKAPPPEEPIVVTAAPTPAPAAEPAAAPTPKAPDAPPASLAERALGLRWMPSATDLVIHVKVAELWNAPLLKGPLSDKMVTDSLAKWKETVGLGPTEIESITVGIPDAFTTAATAISQTPGAGNSANADSTPATDPAASADGIPAPGWLNDTNRFVLVMKTKKAVDLKQIAERIVGGKLREKNGKSYVSSLDNPATAKMAPAGYWAPNPNLLIAGSEAELFSTMERGESTIPRKELTAVDSGPLIVIAAAFPTADAEGKMTSLQAVPGFSQVQDSLKQHALRWGSVGVSIKGGFDLRISAASGTPEGSSRLKAEMETGLASAREWFKSYKEMAPPLIGELGDMIFTNAKIVEQSQVVKISTSVPDSAQAKLEQLPPILMVMAMTSGMGIPGTGLPAGAPGSPAASKFSLKQPGETEGVEPQKAEGLLGGMKIEARTAWSTHPKISSTGTPELSVDLLIDVTGDGLETICGSAGITPKTMKLSDGGTLHASAPKKSEVGDVVPESAFALFDAEDDMADDHPPKTLRVRLSVDAPTSSATTLDVFEGSFLYLTSTGAEQFTIENAVRTASRPLTRTEFKESGLNLRRSHSAVRPQSLTLWCDKGHFLGQVRGMPGDLIAFTEFEKDRTVQRLYSNHPTQVFPDDLQLQFSLYSHVEEKMVRFRFENVPLPSPESKSEAMNLIQTQIPPVGAPQIGLPTTPPALTLPGTGPVGPPGMKRDKNGRVIDD
ncbi:zinc ribbon domain-containing protein [Schlesneria paludicola]|uniref:hypothetical protein n=1 Tax=Schlesneria paludicola TaxID=360056 RepID=UPI000299D20F|nr:hypothetical protein [Schlesneria paludicola]